MEATDRRQQRNRFIGLLRALADEMEAAALLPPLTAEAQQAQGVAFKTRAGRAVWAAWQAGELRSDGRLLMVLNAWAGEPLTDWRAWQGFEALCLEWQAKRFLQEKRALGELLACVRVVGRLIDELERANIE